MFWDKAAPPMQGAARLSQGARLTQALGQWIVRESATTSAIGPFTEKDLQNAYNASRTIIREAVKSLHAKGLIESRQSVGIIVRPHSEWNLFDPDVLDWLLAFRPTQSVVENLIELRRVIEPGIVEIAARRRSPDALALIEEASTRMRASVKRLSDFNAADMAFHNAVFAATQNEYCICLGRAIAGALLRAFEISAINSARALQSVLKHEQVADAIRRGDTGEARDAMLAIIDQAAADLTDRLASGRRITRTLGLP